jgi:hypothetical protein
MQKQVTKNKEGSQEQTFRNAPKINEPLSAKQHLYSQIPGFMSNHGMLRCSERIIQTKLNISQPGDIYEQEADRIADLIINRSSIHSKPVNEKAPQYGDQKVPPVVNEALQTTGQPLDAETIGFMGSRFGYDFSKVRVHTGGKATESATSINATAFTLGNDIVFNNHNYEPKTVNGKWLLAHELTHVVQQANSLSVHLPEHWSGAVVNPIKTRSDYASNSTEEIQTKSEGWIQREYALTPPHPAASVLNLTDKQIEDALKYNKRIVGVVNVKIIRRLRDVLGINPEPAVINQDFVKAIVRWQAIQGLTQDGKLGPATASPLFREIGAEKVGRAKVKKGPTYNPRGTVPPTIHGGQKSAHFSFTVEFEDDPDNGFFPSCGEIRQYIRWNPLAAAGFGANAVPHPGFPAGTRTNTWIEDRDSKDKRYGHRSGKFSDPANFDQYLDSGGKPNQAFGHIYKGNDTPQGPSGVLTGTWEFAVQCVDVCHNEQAVGTNDYIRINW